MADTSANHTIVVGVDGSEASKSALTWAIEEARMRGCGVLAVHAWQFPLVAFGDYGGTGVPMLTPVDLEKLAETTISETVAEIVGDDVSVPVETSIRNGHPARELVEASKGADLLVVGSLGHGGFTGMLLGSVSGQIVHHATCPVVIIRPGWRSSAHE